MGTSDKRQGTGNIAAAFDSLEEMLPVWRGMLDSISEAVCLVDLNGRVVHCNQAMARLLGRPCGQITGRRLVNLVRRHLSAEELDWTKISPKTGNRARQPGPATTGKREKKLVDNNGSCQWLSVSSRPVLNRAGGMLGTLFLFADITGRRPAEEEPSQQRSQLEKAVPERTAEVESISRQLEIERELALALGAAPSREEALPLCLEAAIRASGLDCGGIYLTDGTGRLRLAVATGLSEGFVRGASYYDAGSYRTQFAMQGQPAYVDYDSLSRAEKRLRRDIQSEGIKSAALIPIRHKGEVVALLNVASRSKREIPPATRKVLETIGAQIGRLRTEEELRRSEQKYRSIIANANDGVVLVDAEGKIVEWNRGMERIFGRSREEVLGRSGPEVLFEHLPEERRRPEYRSRLEEKLGSYFETGEYPWPDRIFNQEIIGSDGARRLLQEARIPIQTPGGRMVGSIIRDVTELRKAEASYQELFENLPIGVFRTTPDGRVIMANPCFFRSAGINTQEELEQLRITDLYQDSRDREAVLKELLARGEVRGIEIRLKKCGEVSWVDLTARTVRDESGQVAYFDCAAQDITRRKRAEAKLQQTQELFAAAFNDSPQWVTITTLEEGRYVEVNESFCRMIGYTREEAVGRSAIELGIWTPEVRERFVEVLRERGEIKNYEAPFRTKDGTIKQGLTSARV
ncbi:MAG: PAS domain S-box protein, partial [Syntrophomonadaceae bacterium]|nr:PAS domain S-box protein [Syntrophomonadaceae bacterium]